MKDFTAEIDRALDMLFQVEEVQKKKTLLLDKAKHIYLQVRLFKIPYTAPRNRKLVRLQHSLHGDEPEICLFVPNRKTTVEYKITTDELIDFCVDYYTEFLEKHKVKGITTIMPLKQLTSEYGTYELRKKLVKRFDLFLCKKSLLYNTKFISSLGKTFKVENKIPFGVPFPKDDADFDPEFNENIKKAIYTSGFYISRFSDNYSIRIGTVANTKKELTENLQVVLEQLFEREIIPGGLQNVKAMYLWPSQSKSIPMYFNLEIPVFMTPPRDKVKKKKMKGVEDELSTQPFKKVFVAPTGEVFLSNLKTKSKKDEVTPNIPEIDFEDDESFKDGSDVDDEEDILKTNFRAEKEEDTETEDDEETEKREKRLLVSFQDTQPYPGSAPRAWGTGEPPLAPKTLTHPIRHPFRGSRGTAQCKEGGKVGRIAGRAETTEARSRSTDSCDWEKLQKRKVRDSIAHRQRRTIPAGSPSNFPHCFPHPATLTDERIQKRKNFQGAKSFKDDSDVDDEEDKKDNFKTKINVGKEEEDTETEDDEEIEMREKRFLEERRQAEEEESEEEETNENLNKKQRSKRKRKNESGEERTIAAKIKKSGKEEQKGKMKKAQRKALMKQEKCKLKEKMNQKRKSKQKKV